MNRVLLVFALLTCHLSACMWDRDTLAQESKGRPELAKLIVGWFDRFPPKYYEMRLERVKRELAADPGRLDLYDDAGVACDRLGRSDEAIAWMGKKKSVMDSSPEDAAKAHRYRYLANLGTFHAHRWVSLPQHIRESDLSALREGAELIRQAIRENPDAHFGREIYQLMAMRWLLWDGVSEIEVDEQTWLLFSKTAWVNPEFRSTPSHSDGIAGLIQLGSAWQSPDAFRSLAVALDAERMASLAELAYLRERELLDNGKGSLHPVESVRRTITPDHSHFLEDPKPIRPYFIKARAAADRRNEDWLAYQESRFAKGMHPDTHPDFWNQWVEPPFPKPPGSSFLQEILKPEVFLVMLIGLALCLGTILLLRISLKVVRAIAARHNPSPGR